MPTTRTSVWQRCPTSSSGAWRRGAFIMSKPALMHRMQQIAHVDVNCFYASAERAFNPALEGKPLIVLSNNDGCAVTRSPEAKALGIQTGDPWFKLAPRAKE